MSKIDIAYLLKTGNVKRIPELTYSEYIVASAELFRESDSLRMGQAYFIVLSIVREDISERIRGTHLDAFHDNNLLPAMLAEAYKRW